jgi:hypothetical protein
MTLLGGDGKPFAWSNTGQILTKSVPQAQLNNLKYACWGFQDNVRLRLPVAEIVTDFRFTTARLGPLNIGRFSTIFENSDVTSASASRPRPRYAFPLGFENNVRL